MKKGFGTARQLTADLITGIKTGIFICPRAIVPEGNELFSLQTACPVKQGAGKNRLAVFQSLSSDQRERAAKNSIFGLIHMP